MNLHISFGIYIISTKFFDNISALLQKREKTTLNYSSYMIFFHCCSVQFSRSVVSDSLQPHGMQHTRLPYPSPTPGPYSSLCPLSQWCHPTISFSVIPFSSRLRSFPASGSFKWVSSLNEVAKVLEFQLQHQSFQWIFRTDFLFFLRVLCVTPTTETVV